jgi:CDP-glucose 4,6-dehydratase
VNREFWRGRSVFLTGHTGFKGGWLALWLADAGALVHGYALEPQTRPSFFEVCELKSRLASHRIADIRDGLAVASALAEAQPEFVFHLAAQSLVLAGYDDPVGTYATNVMGTVNLLEAVRHVSGLKAVVNVTSDKCYENREWVHAYREFEPLGGADPYSSSKACSELVTAAYRRSFLDAAAVATASARAGNVIGGGDWAGDRLLPDFFRAIDSGETLVLRSPRATRPWQHVLEPLAGYLLLAEALASDREDPAAAYNFGPAEEDARPVEWLAERLCRMVDGAQWRAEPKADQPHEAGYLKLDSAKARAELGWRPRWRIDEALARTVDWHQAWRRGEDMAAFSVDQIRLYETAA